MKKNFQPITENEILDAEERFINLSDMEIKQLAESSAREQPALFACVAAYYDSLSGKGSKEFFVDLIYSTWIAYNKKYGLRLQLSISDVEKMDAEEEKMMGSMEGNDEAIIAEAIKRLTQHPQPELTVYLYQRIGDFFKLDEADEDDVEKGLANDAGMISGAMNIFVNLMEKARTN